MADEDAGRPRTREREMRDEGRHVGRTREETADRNASEGLGFSLPPMSLPEIRFPERIRLILPIPEPPERTFPTTRVSVSWVLLAVVVVDVLDAIAVVWAGPATLPWVRATVGTLLSVVLAGVAGLAYAWELIAILTGLGWLSVVPTATLLVLARMVRGG